MTLARQLSLAVSVLGTLGVALGCSDSGGPNGTPASLVVVSGNNQSGDEGTALGNPLVVRVANAAGDPIDGITVTWTVTAGGGSLNGSTSTTNAQGETSQSYTLGAAGSNRVRASVTGTSLTVDFSATANAAPITDSVPATIEIASGDNQSATVSTALPAALVVRVRNAAGQALGGVSVDWAAASGGGMLSASNTTTSTQGLASVTYTVGSSAGVNTVAAEVTTKPTITVTFNAAATPVPLQASITVSDFKFTPSTQIVAAGGRVTWAWGGSARHNVTSVGDGFKASPTQTSGTYSVTFSTSTGVYYYYCTIHGTPTSGMRGTVLVR